jgi:hypothetical protein
MLLNLEKTERLLLGALLVLLLVAIFGPAVAQPAHHHDFADQRAWGGIPCALDVLSNLPFAFWGLAGLACLGWPSGPDRAAIPLVPGRLAALFFAGLLITTAASAWYHWQPDDAGLAVDRLGMVFAFAGLMGLAAAERVSSRAGLALAGAVLLLGPLSIWTWVSSANVLPWAVVQFGGMALILCLACLRPLPGALAVRWGLVLMIYAVAKVLEQADAWVYLWSAGMISGHSLKHVVASCAAWPVLAAIMRAVKIRAESGSPSRTGQATPGSHKSLPQNN